MQRLSLIVFLVLTLFAAKTAAINAYPYPIDMVQPDGSTVTVQMHGNEYCHWMTLGGVTVDRDCDGWLRPSIQPTTNPVIYLQAETHTKSLPTTGEHHYLVLLIEFSDLFFTVDDANARFTAMLNEKGYSADGATGSARDYYIDQSLDKFLPTFDVVGPINVGKNMAQFTTDNGLGKYAAPRLLAEACTIADSEVDFSQYDTDNDGTIDNIFFFYAGHNYAEGAEGTIWPHAGRVTYKDFHFDGVKLDQYACTSEYRKESGTRVAGIGNFCHEFAHVLGLPDFYDTNYGGGRGLGNYSLMHSGNFNNESNTPPYFNCEERMRLKWMDSIPMLPAATDDYDLMPVQGNNGYMSPTDCPKEYYLYEYRNQSGWDAPLKPGLLIYHVDKSDHDINGHTASYRWRFGYDINGTASHECFDLMEADDIGDDIPYGGFFDSFTSHTRPAAVSWSGKATGYNLTEISSDGTVAKFHLTYGDIPITDDFYTLNICAIDIPKAEWKAGESLQLHMVETSDPPVSVSWSFDGQAVTVTEIKLNTGTHTIQARLKWADGRTAIATATLTAE